MCFRRFFQAGDIVESTFRIRYGLLASGRQREGNGIKKLGVSKEKL